MFTLSEAGKIIVDGKGNTLFFSGEGKAKFLIEQKATHITAEKLDKIYRGVVS